MNRAAKAHWRHAFALRGLCAVSDGLRDHLIEVHVTALDGGAALLKYSDKTTDPARRLGEPTALQTRCAEYRGPLIISDDIDLATATGGAGVHLGNDDGARIEAPAPGRERAHRRLALRLDRAQAMVATGADYLAFGAFFRSPTQPHARVASLQLLRDAQILRLPRVAIGGITADNARALVDACAHSIAVISALFGASDVRAAARRFASLFDAAHS